MTKARYKQVVDEFTTKIRAGSLTPGTRLPTHRQLAQQYGLALVTASKVYSELSAMGLVSGEIGRGTFVREITLPAAWGTDQQAIADDLIDLNFNYPALPQQTDLLRLGLRQLALSGDLESLLRYQPHGGRDHERQIVTEHLHRLGLTTKADNVLIVDGAQHGLMTTAMALLQAGDVMAVDAITYSGIKVLAQILGIELLPLPQDQQGLDTRVLNTLCQKRNIKALYLQPTVHNPLGWVMSEEKRCQVVTIARHHGLILIEDAPYAFLEKQAPLPLAQLAPERTLYVSSLSKNVATGLRFGFLAAPDKWVPRLKRVIRASTWNTPAIITALACSWIKDGTVERLEKAKRNDASKRQKILSAVFQGCDYQSHPCSYFAWLTLPEEERADQVVNALLKKGISVSTAEPFTITPHIPHAIRLALGSVELTTLNRSLQEVRKTIEY
ncbi:PLP-dependent aminotransferase family protein [Nitrincola sp.]|uniref:aminotransferase-like domain-containing protein n=1 Tax=Nitrincola sp. TaxID=1926584 RepID=UPI003A8EC191